MGATLLMTGSRLALVAALGVLGCVDSPAGPGRFGQLRVRPAYVAADAPGAIGAGLDSAAVRITRLAEPDDPLVDTTVTYQSDTASLGWILDLREDAESLAVEITIWGDAQRLYTGDEHVLVHDESFATTPTEPVDVSYVGPPIVAAIAVSPGDAALDALGATAIFAAEASDRHGAIVPGASFTWTSANTAVATVNADGEITAVGNGTTLITAANGSITGSASVVVQQRVAAMAVTPPAITLTARGTTQALVAQATDPNGHTVANAAVSWTSDAVEVASVDATTGVVTAISGGSATITATSGGVAATAAVTVNPIADVASIVVTPGSFVLTAVGATRQFAAEARDAEGSVLHGVQFTWASTVTAVATVDQSGVASAAAHGATQITASAGAVTGAASLTVDLSQTIASVDVTPASATLSAVGATQAYEATARDAAGAIVPVTGFAWTSSTPGVASIDGPTGIATAVGHGVTTITATAGGVSGSSTLQVDLGDVVASVTVTPTVASISVLGGTQEFHAEAFDAAGIPLHGVPFVWTSSATEVASIDPATGLATATGQGATTITARAGGHEGTATLTVSLVASVASITVSPDADTLTAAGTSRQFSAVARDAAGTVLPGVAFVWTSADPAVATIGATGLAVAVAHGQTTITAAAAGVSGQALLAVDLAATIDTVIVSPANATLINVGETQAFTAEARDADGNVVPVASFAWSTVYADVAEIDALTGVATAVSYGNDIVRATVAGVTGEATLLVDLKASIASVEVLPATVTLTAIGDTVRFTAIARDRNGNELSGVLFAWISSDPTIVDVHVVTGVATAVSSGTVTISAIVRAFTGTATASVALSGSALEQVSPANPVRRLKQR